MEFYWNPAVSLALTLLCCFCETNIIILTFVKDKRIERNLSILTIQGTMQTRNIFLRQLRAIWLQKTK